LTPSKASYIARCPMGVRRRLRTEASISTRLGMGTPRDHCARGFQPQDQTRAFGRPSGAALRTGASFAAEAFYHHSRPLRAASRPDARVPRAPPWPPVAGGPEASLRAVLTVGGVALKGTEMRWRESQSDDPGSVRPPHGSEFHRRLVTVQPRSHPISTALPMALEGTQMAAHPNPIKALAGWPGVLAVRRRVGRRGVLDDAADQRGVRNTLGSVR